MPATKFGTIKVDKLSVTEIDVPSTNSDNEVGTLKLSDNLEVGGDGLILHDLDDYDFSTANIDLDNGDDDDDNNNDNIVTYSDETTTTVTAVNSNRIITVADSTKSSTSEQNITINGRPYTIIQSGTTITLVDTLKKIISLEAGNLVIATYKSDGTRIDKEIIMDTNNSISEIANGSFDLKVKTLDVTNTTSINESAPSPDGSARIDNNLEVGGATILNGSLTATTGAFTTLSTSGLLSANAGLTVATGQTLTSNSVNITGGAIEGTVIGSNNNPAAGTFTDLTVNDSLVIAAGATIIGDTEGQITLNVEGAPGQTQDIFTVRQNGSDVNKLEVDKDGVTTAASLVVSTNLTITPSVITSASIEELNPTNLDESVSVFYFDLDSASAMYGIFSAGTTGQMINIFYDNNNPAGSLRIDFGATKLRTGSGESQYLTFTITGQSASLMYISTVDKWCVINTGAAVS